MKDSLAIRYLRIRDDRRAYLEKLPKNVLVNKVLGLELGTSYFQSNADEYVPEDLIEQCVEAGAEVLNTVLYYETRRKVSKIVERDFTPENDEVRQQLTDTLTELVIELRDDTSF